MTRRFNVAGACDDSRHFMIPAAPRLPRARPLIEDGAYFVLHAPRQTGKTTTLRAIAKELTAEGTYAALHFSCEAGRAFPEDPERAAAALLGDLLDSAQQRLPPELQPPPESAGDGASRIRHFFWGWARACPRPIVLFFDEIDSLAGPALMSVLSQLRAGHASRPSGFPWSIALCGMRDVRDYKAASGEDPTRFGSSSPFNIQEESLRLGDFTKDEVRYLYAQHTQERGRAWSNEAVDRSFELGQGQPWLTNAIGREIDLFSEGVGPIDAAQVDEARERLIRARATHLDSLVERLREDRVRRVIGPLLSGDEVESDDTFDDDLAYVRDLGLVAQQRPIRIANPIYREIILRVLASRPEQRVEDEASRFQRGDGSLDLQKMMNGFADFWQQHGEALGRGMAWQEIAPHLVLMGYLHAIINGTGVIDRETGVGRGRIDLLIRWPMPGGAWQRDGMELKVWRTGEKDPLERGLLQLDGYLTSLGLDCGTLVIFDRRHGIASAEERTRWEEARSPGGRTIAVLRA